MLTAIKCTGTSIDTVLIEASLPQLLIGELNLFGDDLDLGHIPDNGAEHLHRSGPEGCSKSQTHK